MSIFYERLHAYLVDSNTDKLFEDTSTHYLNAWSSEFEMPHGTPKTFAVVMCDLFLALSGNRSTLTYDTLIENSCNSTMANEIIVAFDETETNPDNIEVDYKTFATRLATFHPSHIQTLLTLFCSSVIDIDIDAEHHHKATPTPSIYNTQASSIETSKQKRKTRWWRKYKCICVFPHNKRAQWY